MGIKTAATFPWQAELGNFAVDCKSDSALPRPRDKIWDIAKTSVAGAR